MAGSQAISARRLVVVFLLGFAGGLPLLLTSQTLQAWMTGAGATLEQIATISLVGLAYTFKFLWAPLLDRFALPFLGRRRGWLLALQLALAAAIVGLGLLDPIGAPHLFFAAAFLVAFLSASLDIVIDAFKVDILTPDERAAGSSAYVIGYRLALVVAGGAISFGDALPWSVIYASLGGLLAVGLVATIIADEPPAPADRPTTFQDAVVKPFSLFAKRPDFATVVAFVVLYRFGDYFAQALIIPFLKRGVGFDFKEIGVVYQVLGFGGILLGGVAAGLLVPRYGLKRMLIACGIAQAVTNLLYVFLAITGRDLTVFSAAVLVDNFANAMGVGAFTAYLMSVCSPAVSATQFALLTSLASVGQRVFGPFADDIVDAVGWTGFFTVTTLLAIPGLVLATRLVYDRDR